MRCPAQPLQILMYCRLICYYYFFTVIITLLIYSYFKKGCRKKVHATIPKGIVGDLEFTVFQRNFKEWHEKPWTYCLRELKESNKSRFDSYSVRKSALIISHITFRDCRVHSSSDNLSRNSCISRIKRNTQV